MKITLAVFLALVLASCRPVTAGKVIEKIYHPAWTEHGTDWMDIGDVKIPIPYTTEHPERYQLRLEASVDGKTKTGLVAVPSETYHRVNVGEIFGAESEL